MYLLMRDRGDLNILYEYYKDHYDSSKHKRFLHPQEFYNALQLWNAMGVPAMMNIAVQYFDNKFNIAQLTNKEGQLIKLV